jgi:AmmeMemoRadiSam system protein A
MLSLSEAERKAIVELARRALIEAVYHRRLLQPLPGNEVFTRRCGVFVSLHAHGRLRGCIGVLDRIEPLGESLVRCAYQAALEDPRFSRMQVGEVNDTEIEISLLSPLERIRPEEIELGKHGLLAERGSRRGLLLPQVAAEHHLEREQFLEETCRKAGLSRDAWKDGETIIHGFTCEIISESEFRSG